MMLRSVFFIVSSMVLMSCGGGSSTPTTNLPEGFVAPSEGIGCPQHVDFFNQLSGLRTGSLSEALTIGPASCQFDVTLEIDNNPQGQLCTVTGRVSYTATTLMETGSICDPVTDSRNVRIEVLDAISFQPTGSITLPNTLGFEFVATLPSLDANGTNISYPFLSFETLVIDENFNILQESQVLAKP